MDRLNLKNIAILIGGIYLVFFMERLLKNQYEMNQIIKEDKQINNIQLKIDNYEKGILKDSAIVWSSDRSTRDSLRAILNPR